MWKVILKTILATFFLTIFLLGIFIKSITGALGYMKSTAEFAAELAEMRRSHEIVEKMKKRHVKKNLRIKKRFVKKVGSKVATSAAAAATIGTAAVVVTVVSLEIDDYCEEREQLMEDENILYERDQKFDLKQCAKDARADSKQIVVDVKDSISAKVKESWEKTAEATSEKWSSFKDGLKDISESMRESIDEFVHPEKSWRDWFSLNYSSDTRACYG